MRTFETSPANDFDLASKNAVHPDERTFSNPQMSPLVLSSQGLQRTASMNHNNFTFIGNTCKFQCTQFQAAFISPRVHSLLQTDITVESFVIQYQATGVNEKRMFEFLEHLVAGLPIDPNPSEVNSLSELGGVLDNWEVLNFCHTPNPIDNSNVCLCLKKADIRCCLSEEVEFAASHFHDLDLNQLKQLDISILEKIVSSDSLVLQSEDSLLDFILQVDWDERNILVRHVRPEYLSCESMALFIECLGDSIIDPLIWDSVCHRLVVASPAGDSGGLGHSGLLGDLGDLGDLEDLGDFSMTESLPDPPNSDEITTAQLEEFIICEAPLTGEDKARLMRVLERFTPVQRSQFVAFCTGSPRLPKPLRGWDRIRVMEFQRSTRPPDSFLPITHTAFQTLEMPRYSSEDIAYKRLLDAVSWTVGGF
jgi:hypothetical protein